MQTVNKRLLCWLVLLTLGAMNLQAASNAGRSTKNRFFLLSKYTKDEVNIDEKAFAATHAEIARNGAKVYRNGQTYHVLVPWKALYIRGTDNLVENGGTFVNNLANFLGFYDIEYMKITGFYPTAKVHEQSGRPELPADSVAQQQAARLVTKMQHANKRVAKVSISVADVILHTPPFINEQYRQQDTSNIVDPQAWFSELRESVIAVQDDSRSPTIYEDGGALIEFKKY